MNYEIIYKMMKYLLCGISMFLILKYAINENMKIVDISLITTVAILIFAIVDNGYSVIENKIEINKKINTGSKCVDFCAMKEHMENIEPNNNNEAIITNDNKNTDQTKTDYDKFQNRFSEIIDERTQHNPKYIIESDKIARKDDASYDIYYKRRSPAIKEEGSRSENDVIKNETKYNIVSYHTIPQDVNEGSFEHGYAFLPPSQWYPTPPHPPVCVAEKKCPVCPALSNSQYADLKEWNSSRRISAPDEINVEAVEEKLNAGR
jgi:hypothetical protein